jgi:hypothetical protein
MLEAQQLGVETHAHHIAASSYFSYVDFERWSGAFSFRKNASARET